MKKLVAILCVSMFAALELEAQVKFTVPSLTDIQKYQIAAVQWNGSYLIQISYAKSLGKSVEDVATFVADQFKVTWNKSGGFEGFVRSMLYNMVSFVPNGSVEITEQSDKSIMYKVTGLYSDLREGGSIFNVTYREYVKFWEIVNSRLSDSMGAKYSQKDTSEGLIVTIERNP